ncbi:hypothetical protein POV27_15645 [Aureisphaera galaxeae]|uniref:hypothetical protein n=1 Tax=Aureisphaera galaxeae TaxID=1538023 RepID=UPI002350C539|nr:hypothetical protein [Aureisphaera galaxeae]MDC8005491.1 hypothetical protein [Aureisphaera galaxeae]
MNSKWYLSTLFIILTVLGISLDRTTSPNQEILVQFNSDEVTFDEAQKAIAVVKAQLQNIGVENIQVSTSANGKLKITYYSEVDVASIQNILSSDNNLELGYVSYSDHESDSNVPFGYDIQSYQLNVSEIQKSSNFDSDYEGYLVEFKSSKTRYYHIDIYFSKEEIDFRSKNRVYKTAYEVHSNNALLIDNSSHNIPEVRAGPIA